MISCRDGFYKHTPTYYCLRCQSECELCTGYNNCTKCSFNFYLNRINSECVRGELCPSGTYPESTSRLCMNCNYMCQTCVGPGPTECIKCNFIRGFIKKKSEIVSGCMKLYCTERYFEDILPTGKHICTPCDPSCLECRGHKSSECLKCTGDLILIIDGSGSRCRTCGDIHPGYIGQRGDPMNCTEVCGDGRNMGVLPCDDANLVGGDGCSALCAVERGFACHGGSPHYPDICTDILPPVSYILGVSLTYHMLISFSEFIRPICTIYLYIYSTYGIYYTNEYYYD